MPSPPSRSRKNTNQHRPASNKKRRRRQQQGGEQEDEPSSPSADVLPLRPDPPPPPPASLVRLIQKDASVLKYFQALQSNLDYDVQKWKSRARALEHKHQQSQAVDDSERQSKSADRSRIAEEKEEEEQKRLHRRYEKQSKNNTTSNFKASAKNDVEEESCSSSKLDATKNDIVRPPLPPPLPAQEKDGEDNKDDDFELEFSSSSSSEEEQHDEVQDRKTKAAAKSKVRSSFGIHKKNFALDFSSASSSSSSEDEEQGDPLFPRVADSTTAGKRILQQHHSTPTLYKNKIRADTQLAIDQLQPVLQTLEQLGILLLDKEEIAVVESSITTADNDKREPTTTIEAAGNSPPGAEDDMEISDGNQEQRAASSQDVPSFTRYILRRRSDQDVAIDILHVIRSWTRIKYVVPNSRGFMGGGENDNDNEGQPKSSKELLPYYFPFMTGDSCVPCYMSVPHCDPSSSTTSDSSSAAIIGHPAVSGVEKLLKCLCYMDVFCPALDQLELPQQRDDLVTTSQEVQTSTIITTTTTNNNNNNTTTNKAEDNKLRSLLLAMKGRKILVSSLLQSLEGEIVDTWSIQDRSMRLLTKATLLSSIQSNADSIVPQNSIKPANGNHDHLAETNTSDFEAEQHEVQTITSTTIPFGSKSFVRLSGLVERSILAKIVTTLYLFRQDSQKAFQVFWSYLLSATPALDLEDHPKLSPVLSFCIIEAILSASVPESGLPNGRISQRTTLLDWMASSKAFDESSQQGMTIQRVLGLVWNSTANIYRARNGENMDDRITDVSRVELAAYARLLAKQKEGSQSLWWENVDSSSTVAAELEQLLRSDHDGERVGHQYQATSAVTTLASLLQGDASKIDDSFDRALSNLKECALDLEIKVQSQERLLACVSAKKQLEIRRLDEYRRVANTPMIFVPNRTGNKYILSYSKAWIDWLITQEFNHVAPVAISAFRCCQACSDGESSLRLAHWIITHLPDRVSDTDHSLYSILEVLEAMSHVLTVRVINLERRPDRLAAFSTQAMCEGLMVVKGVSTFLDQRRDDDNDDSVRPPADLCSIGEFAHDGQGKAAEVERRLVRAVGGKQESLNALVATHWAPNELKPFDSEAPDNDTMVLISPSEKACALSHVSCWKGVERCLSSTNFSEATSSSPILRDPIGLRQRFLCSGFARGTCLFSANDRMEPSPVCLILEDDAVLVDRFSARLTELLEELPRDFHFCALGYSRPKTAPLVPFSSQLGTPTSIWYLTGYILSLEGARYLLNKLPVVGPVDSWIGLSMFTNNWDNVFGHAMGVGVSAKPQHDPSISKDDLRKVLRFRAFAATIPLCSQRVGNLSDLPSTNRNWRQRDTDIVFSGNG